MEEEEKDACGTILGTSSMAAVDHKACFSQTSHKT
jgi:hypothetical protein